MTAPIPFGVSATQASSPMPGFSCADEKVGPPCRRKWERTRPAPTKTCGDVKQETDDSRRTRRRIASEIIKMTRNTKSMWRLASLRPMRKISSAVAIVLLIGIEAFAQSASPAPGDVELRVEAILSRMTLEEKIDMLGGVDDFFIRALPRLGLPRLKMADGPVGVRNFGPATADRK